MTDRSGPGDAPSRAAGPRVRRAGTVYFFYYAAMAGLFPFLVLHYQHLGLSGRQIGVLSSIPPALILVGASLWGAVADATQRHRLVLVLAFLGTMAAVAVLSVTPSFATLIPVVALLALCQAPIMPLVDNSVMELLGDLRARYGRVRLWGAVGWGAAGPVAGALVERYGLSWSFGFYEIALSLCLAFAVGLPVSHARLAPGGFRQGLRTLVGHRQWLVFLFVAFASGAGLAVVHHFLFLYLEGIGAGPSMMGWALTVGMVSEMAVFFYADRLLQRWGRRRLLILSVLAGAVRVSAYAWIHVPEAALVVQLLHGPSFALMWVAGVATAHGLAPPGLGATAQGQFLGVNFGLGGATGALLGGIAMDAFGAHAMYGGAAVWLLLGVTVYAVASRDQKESAEPADSGS